MPQRNWLITGASSGFGRIMTEQLLSRGDRTAGTVRDLSVMTDLKARSSQQSSPQKAFSRPHPVTRRRERSASAAQRTRYGGVPG